MSDKEKPNPIEEAQKRLAELEADLLPLREIPEGVRLSDVDAYMYRHWPVRIIGGFVGDQAVIAPHGMPQDEFDRHRANFLRRTEDQRRAAEDTRRRLEDERRAIEDAERNAEDKRRADEDAERKVEDERRAAEDQRRADEDAQRAIAAKRKAEADKKRGKRQASKDADDAEAHAQKLMAAGATQGSAWIESEAKYKLQPGTLKKRKQRNKK